MASSIIGGADGPTRIFIATGTNWYLVSALVLAAVLGGLFLWRWRRK